MRTDVVHAKRRAQRAGLLQQARDFAASLPGTLGVQAVVVAGSVARGDFNVWSDVDVLVVADRVPERYLDRLALVEPRPPAVQPFVWTSAEWRRELDRRNPLAVEARDVGVWLRGSAARLVSEQREQAVLEGAQVGPRSGSSSSRRPPTRKP